MNSSEPEPQFVYSSRDLSGSSAGWHRIFEILPGLASWGLLVGMTVLSWVNPTAAVIGIIMFDLFWVFFMVYSAALMVALSLRLRIEKDTDWMARLEEINSVPEPNGGKRDLSIFQRASEKIYRAKLEQIHQSGATIPNFDAIHHVVILSVTGDDRKTIEAAIDNLLLQDFPLERVMVVLAAHENVPRSIKETAWGLHREHFESFEGFYVAPHPAGEPGEPHIKGAAVNYAARMAISSLEEKSIDPSSVIVSCLEVSAMPHPRYLACLTWNYLVCPDREQVCFQPQSVYHPNVWKAPGFASILHVGSSFLSQIEATNPDGLITFTSYSMSLSLLVRVDYWPDEDTLSDDSAFFWKAYLKLDGKIRVIPIYTTLVLDTIRSDTFKNTLVEVYRRKKKEALAIRNLPVIFRGFLHCREIPLFLRTRHAVRMLQKHVGTATWIFLLLIIGWMPGIVAGQSGKNSSLGYIAPRIHAVIFFLAFTGLAIAALTSAFQLPREKPMFPPKKWVQHLLAWIFLPLFALALNAYPYLVVQTRLMFGRRK